LVNLSNAADLNGLMSQIQTAATNSGSNPASALFGSFSMGSIVVGIVAGLFGSAYFLYGKRQGNFPMLFTGMALWVVPFFISSVLWLSLACGALAFAPFVIGRYF
jgi:hypothetical protein